jgi:GTP cyclohydrolase I
MLSRIKVKKVNVVSVHKHHTIKMYGKVEVMLYVF